MGHNTLTFSYISFSSFLLFDILFSIFSLLLVFHIFLFSIFSSFLMFDHFFSIFSHSLMFHIFLFAMFSFVLMFSTRCLTVG